MATPAEESDDILEWDETLSAARKDLRNGRLILSGLALVFLFLIWAALPAARGGESELGEMSQEGAYIAITLSSLMVLLAVASWLRPIPAFLVARWLAIALAVLNAGFALLALFKGLGLKVVTKHAFKFASSVWGAELMGAARDGAILMAELPNPDARREPSTGNETPKR